MKVKFTALKKIAITGTCIAATTAAVFAAACTDGGGKTDTPEKPEVTYPQYLTAIEKTEIYTETPVYIMNEETDRRVYCIETVPNELDDGEKIPLIIYVHGGNGDATSLIALPENLAESGFAGITFECCGANKFSPKSDGKEIYSSHYTSRISDLETVIEHAKTLDYVDTDKIYIYGQSYGGLVCMMDAPYHNDDIRGMFLESTGLTEDGSMVTNTGNGIVEKYLPPEDYKSFMNGFTKDVLIFCSQEDETGAHENGAYTATVYESRGEGETKFYSYAGGGHSFSLFEQAAKDDVYRIIAAYINTGEILEQGENT